MNQKKIINYPVNYYSCWVIINGHDFTELEISQYYKTKPGRSTVSDEVIQKLVRQLNGKEIEKKANDYYDFEPLYIDHQDYRAYNLVWDYDEEKPVNKLIIIDCYREKKFDRK